MMFRAFIFSSAIVTVAAQCPEIPEGGCNICGNDLVTGERLCVQDSDRTDDFLFGKRCGVRECEDRNKNVDASFCTLTQRLAVQLCNCGTSSSGSSPSALLACPDAPEETVSPPGMFCYTVCIYLMTDLTSAA